MRKEVVCALIVQDGKLLVTQHGMHSRHPWKWEFPGGKIQPGETYEEALAREIREEINLEIRIDDRLLPVTHSYDDKEIRLYPFLCRQTGGNLQLNEHHHAVWVFPDEVSGYDMLDADREMLAEGDNFARLQNYAPG